MIHLLFITASQLRYEVKRGKLVAASI